MTRARWRAILFLLFAAALVAAAAVSLSLSKEARTTPGERPTLLLLTSLPLVFGEQFSLESEGSPALDALRQHYHVVPISVTDPKDLAKGKLLLMAHPRAQPAEDLVALDDWVRRGGRALLLADPMLEWPSARPLGDRLRPPLMFTDTGLLAHWGLRLDSPDERGPKMRSLAGNDVLTVSPGELSGRCAVSPDRLVARCKLGAGAATIIADADFLDVERLDGPASNNLKGLLGELAILQSK